MLRLAGEIADGVLLWLCYPSYIRDVVIPEVTAGRERAGLSSRASTSCPPCPPHSPRTAAAPMRRCGATCIPYFGLPFYRAMIERTGFGADIEAYDAAAGDLDAMQAAISDDFLDELTAVGESAVRAGVERYREAGATSPCIGPIPKTDFEATCARSRLAAGRRRSRLRRAAAGSAGRGERRPAVHGLLRHASARMADRNAAQQMIVLLGFAVLAGAGTALSPCVLPVLPALLSAGGVGGRRRPLGIVLGLSITFTVTIVGVAMVVDGVGLGSDPLRDLAIVVLLAFGVGAAPARPGGAARGAAVAPRALGPALDRRRLPFGPARRRRARLRLHALRQPDPGGGDLRERRLGANDR